MNKMKIHTYEDLRKKWMKDPAFKKAWDALEDEDRLIRATIDARLRKNMSQCELAEKMGTKQSAISRFESGKNKNPTLGLIRQLATALGLQVEIKLKTK